MAVRRFIEVFLDHPIHDLPEYVLKAITPAERAAYADVTGTFRRLAEQSSLPSLARLLSRCSADNFNALELHAYADVPLKAYFRFILRGGRIGVRLPDSTVDLRAMPDVLGSVYSSVGGIRMDDFPMGGGLWTPDEVQAMSLEFGSLDGPQQAAPGDCLMFFDNGSGDLEGVHVPTSMAVSFDHERGSLELNGPVAKALDSNFNLWAKG